MKFETKYFKPAILKCIQDITFSQHFMTIPIKFRIYKMNGFLNIDFYMNNTYRLMYEIILTLDPVSYCKICSSRPMEKSTKGNESSGTPCII